MPVWRDFAGVKKPWELLWHRLYGNADWPAWCRPKACAAYYNFGRLKIAERSAPAAGGSAVDVRKAVPYRLD